MKIDLTPDSKSTRTPSRSQNILYLNDEVSLRKSSLSSDLLFDEVKKPVSDCCLAFFLEDDFSDELPFRFDDMMKLLLGDNDEGGLDDEMNAVMEQ